MGEFSARKPKLRHERVLDPEAWTSLRLVGQVEPDHRPRVQQTSRPGFYMARHVGAGPGSAEVMP